MSFILIISFFVTCYSQPLRQDIFGHGGIVGTSNWYATNAARRVLREGGSAIDAALAVQTVLSVVEPQNSGFGGGSYILYLPANAVDIIAIDGREEAPYKYNPYIFCKDDGCFTSNVTTPAPTMEAPSQSPTMEPTQSPVTPQRRLQTSCDCSGMDDVIDDETAIGIGGFTNGVPGTLAAFAQLYIKYGSSKGWKYGFLDAIYLARDGFEVSKELSEAIEREYTKLSANEYSKNTYLSNGIPKAKDVIKNQKLAETLADLAQDESNDPTSAFYDFYTGDYAEHIVSESQSAINSDINRWGLMEMVDMANYSSVLRNVVGIDDSPNGYRIYGMPSSGSTTVMQMMGLYLNLNGDQLTFLNDFPAGANITQKGNASAEAFHYFVMTNDIAFADRYQYIGDNDFRVNDNNISSFDEALLHPTYITNRAKATYKESKSGIIDPGVIEASPRYTYGDNNDFRDYAGKGTVNGSTGYFIIDSNNNAIVVTSSLGDTFGSGVMTEDGILLNNALKDFDRYGDGMNGPQGGKIFRNNGFGGGFSNYGGKRPRSDMSPLIARASGNSNIQGLFASASGIAGMSTTFQTVARQLINQPSRVIPLTLEAVNLPRVWSFNNGTIVYSAEEWSIANDSNFDTSTNSSTFIEGIIARGYKLYNNESLFAGVGTVLTYYYDGVDMQFGSMDQWRINTSMTWVREYGWYSIYIATDTYRITCIIVFSLLGCCCVICYILCCAALDDDDYYEKTGDYYNKSYQTYHQKAKTKPTPKPAPKAKPKPKQYPGQTYNEQKEALIKKDQPKPKPKPKPKTPQPKATIQTQPVYYAAPQPQVTQVQYPQPQPVPVQYVQPQYIQATPQYIQQQPTQVQYVQTQPVTYIQQQP